MKFFVFLYIALSSYTAWAYKPDKCFKFVHSNAMRKYEYPGNISSEYMTKKHGTTGGTTENSMQSSTAMMDPYVWFGRLTSSTQFSSSFGACSYFAFQKELKKEYIDRNDREIREEVALGRGEHLNSIFYYSQCEASVLPAYYEELQRNFDYVYGERNLTDAIDLVILATPHLRQACEVI